MEAFSSNGEDALNRTLSEEEEIQVPEEEIASYFELGRCVKWIEDKGFSKVCLQFPDSLLRHAALVGLHIEANTSARAYILGDTSYGSCCVDEIAAQHVKGDAIIHFGHACLSPITQLPTLYVFSKHDLDVPTFVDRLSSLDSPPGSLLLYDLGYLHLLERVVELLPDNVRERLVISRLTTGTDAKEGGRCGDHCTFDPSGEAHAEEWFGRSFCPLGSSQVTSAVYLGKGDDPLLKNFTLLLKGADISYFDPSEGSFRQVSGTHLFKRISFRVEKLKQASLLGVLAGTLGIRGHLDAIQHIKHLVKRYHKKCYIISVGKPNVAKLSNFPEIDVFVAVSCPEASFGNEKDYYKPIVSTLEVELAFNENRSWDNTFSSDFRDLIKGGRGHIPPPVGPPSKVADISLIDNRVNEYCSEEEESLGVALRPHMAVGVISSRENTVRTWNGLEQRVGSTCVTGPVKGRDGMAQGYSDEKDLM